MPQTIRFGNAPAVRCNGRRLGALLSKVISERTSTADERDALVQLLANAATTAPATVENLLAGSVDLPPNSWIEKWSVLLDVPTWVLTSASGRDTDEFLASLEPQQPDVAMLNAARSVVLNCGGQSRASADDVLSAVVNAAAETVRRLA